MGHPESQARVLPDGIDGMRAIELGCGTAYVSAWLAGAGAHPVGIDLSEKQLATARAMQAEFGIDFPLILGNAEKVPYEDNTFDLAISEFGASLWCDPYQWIPEAARLLVPGGGWSSCATHRCSRCACRPRDRCPPRCPAGSSA